MGDVKYTGEESIVVAMDIGTTHSMQCSSFKRGYNTITGAVSFAYLYPDDYVRIRMVCQTLLSSQMSNMKCSGEQMAWTT